MFYIKLQVMSTVIIMYVSLTKPYHKYCVCVCVCVHVRECVHACVLKRTVASFEALFFKFSFKMPLEAALFCVVITGVCCDQCT